jgi:hypothetical protein
MKGKKKEPLIWWLSQDDVERIEWLGVAGLLSDWPEYLTDEFASRNGRPGRGRLWVADQFGDVGAKWDNELPTCKMAKDSGGIVIEAADYMQVVHLPGFVTRFDMSLVITKEP